MRGDIQNETFGIHKSPFTQVSVVSSSGSLFKAGGVVKALNDRFVLPGRGGDVVHDAARDFLGHHAEHTDLQHWQTHTLSFTKSWLCLSEPVTVQYRNSYFHLEIKKYGSLYYIV